MIVRGRGVANDGVTPRRTLLVARPVTRTWVVAPVNRGDLAAIYGDWSLNFPPSVTPDEPRSMLEKSTFYAKNETSGPSREFSNFLGITHLRRELRKRFRGKARVGGSRPPTRGEMACRSRALVRAAREATRPHAWRVRGTRGLASSPAARARVDPTASVHPRARLASDAALGPFCVVSAGAVVGPGCRIGAGVHLLGDVELGAGCVLRSHAVVGAEVRRAPTRREDAPPT